MSQHFSANGVTVIDVFELTKQVSKNELTDDDAVETLRASLERPAAAPFVVRLRGSQERVQATLSALSAGAGVSGPSTKC